MKSIRIIALALAAIAAFLTGCADRAFSNVQTLYTKDCGVNWQLIKVGEPIPYKQFKCEYHVTVPDYPLQGDTRFKTMFKGRVLAEVEVAYDYSIFDAIVFVGEAKYIGKANTDATDKSNASGLYEAAENAVIDKRIRDIAADMLLKEDIVDFSQAEFEDKLLAAVNEVLKSKGVKLNFLSFVPIPEEQTRLAIDMLTAYKVYESRGLAEFGQKLAIAKAGAARITLTAPQPKADEKK
ncbi:MAG: hypothetical protein E6Q06_04090 [Candidatus Moraniibacteriota bacterium]|nr:MAG: hypothetical protein E6Q06_04090 [Candidatus Moranbacteria bacterium]